MLYAYMQTSNKNIAKNTAFLYIRMLVIMVVTFYTSRIILQVLGAEDYGIYNVVGGIVTMMGFLNGALGSSTSRFLTYELGKGNQRKLKDTFSASLNLHICVAILVLLIGETIGLWFFCEKLVIPEGRMNAAFWVYQFSIITTMINFTQVPFNATLIAHENMSIYAYVGLYEALSKLAIVYLIAISPIDRLVFYAFLLMINQIGIQFFYRCYTLKKYEECRFELIKDRQLYKALIGYSGWDMFGGVAVICQTQGINILLNLFFGPMVNAARAIAVQVQGAIVSFVNNFLAAVRPQVVKNYAEGNIEAMYSLTFNAAKYAYSLMLALVLPICFEIKFVLNIWLGGKEPDDTAIFIILILLTYLMETYHLASLMSYHAIGKIKIGNIVGGTLMMMALPLSYVALHLGAPAYFVFIVVFCVNLTQMFWGWMIVHRYVEFSYRRLLKVVYVPTILITMISVIAPSIITSFLQPSWGRLILLIIVSEVIIFVSVYYIALNIEERKKALAFIKKKIHINEKTDK